MRAERPSLAQATAGLNAWVEVDLDALTTNVAAIRDVLKPGTEIIAVVKANAYGHGAAPVARWLEAQGAERFGVAWVSEALSLRSAGITRPIIIMGHAFPSDAAAIVTAGVICTVHTREMADAISAAAVEFGREAAIHIKVDTGLHRFGNSALEALELAEYCRGLPGVLVEGIWTHMANADEPDDGFSAAQLKEFKAARSRLGWIPYAHAANSATTLRRPELHFDGVRPGIALYGICPPNCPDVGLRPALSLKARLARVQELAPGEGVSYGLTWRAAERSVVGLVPVGYGDGWRRTLGNTGQVLAGGQRCPMVGRVCMDQFLVDLTHLPTGAIEGEEVVLLGSQGDAQISADEVGALTGTISWEVVAALLPRLPRIYRSGDRVVSLDAVGESAAGA